MINTIATTIKRYTAVFMLFALVLGSIGLTNANTAHAAAAPNWNATGSYVIDMQYQGSDNPHDMTLSEDNAGNLTGNGGSPAGANTYTWVVNSGTVSGDAIDFTANYTATADAVTPQTVLTVDGTVAQDGTMSGTWSDNYQGGARSGTWMSTSGNAVAMQAQNNSNVTVNIIGYVNNMAATAANANNSTFTQNATWNATNIGAGSGQYTLDATNTPTAYQTATVAMSSGANYSTNEVMDSTVATSCTAGGAPYSLQGYSSGDTLAAAQAGVVSTTAPSFTNLTTDKYVIVWNTDCATGGQIGGTVTGGAGTGTLAVTGVTTVNSTATADGTFANGWKYTFHITVPTNETHLAMKFGDWTMTGGTATIGAANNIRISSAQADNSNATVMVTAANTYTTPVLNITSDLDPNTDGLQADVTVETAVPVNSTNGSYTTNYGVETQ